MSSWNSWRLTSARRVATWDQLRNTAHLRQCSHGPPGKPSGQDEVVIKTHVPSGLTARAKPLVAWVARTWDGHKTQAQLSLHLCGVPENLNLSSLDLRSARNAGPAPCRATWSLSSVDRESTPAVSGGKPSVAETLRALPTHARDICLQCPSLPTAWLNKWA